MAEERFSFGQISLCNDTILYMAQQFLSPQESLYLALSRVSDRFNELYAINRSKLNISQCYGVTLDPWQRFFQRHNFAPNLTVFDASSCYWLPASVLSHSITLMTSLVELGVEDSQIRLTHLPDIFEACPNVAKLSFTLLEVKLDQVEEGEKGKKAHNLLKRGFGNLTSLRVFTLPSGNTEHCVDVWLAIFGVLKWCQNCIHLVIDIPLAPSRDREDESTITNLTNKAYLESQKLLPHLEWLRSLKTLAIFRHGHRFVWSDDSHGTDAIKLLINIFLIENCWPGESLERFWLEFNSVDWAENSITSPIVKSLLLSYPNNTELLKDDRFRHLEHLGGVDSDSFPFDGLPCLKYFQGRVSNIQAFNQFCELHPMLEYLHIAIYAEDISGDVENIGVDDFPVEEGNPVLFHGTWKLLHLKKLVYIGDYWPLQEGKFEARIFEACPNIQELHMHVTLDAEDSFNFFKTIRLKHLTTLTIEEVSLPKGETLCDKLEKQCPKLKCLHLTGSYDDGHDKSFGSGKHLPRALKLRDFRLRWNKIHLFQFPMLLYDIATDSPLLERLVVHIEGNEGRDGEDDCLATKLEETIVDIVEKLKHLVLLVLIGFPMNSKVVRRVNQRLTQDVLPLRPALKFYLDAVTFPDATDPTVPRIHCNEMIHPQEQYFAPPPVWASL